MNPEREILGTGAELKRRPVHPYIDRPRLEDHETVERMVSALNADRTSSGPFVEVDYYLEVETPDGPLRGLEQAARMILEHGTVKPWGREKPPGELAKPAGYDENLSRITDIAFLGHNRREGLAAGVLTIAYPLHFFLKTSDGSFPLAQLLTACAGEPVSALSLLRAARLIDLRFPDALKATLPGRRWPHRRLREYLGIAPEQPLIGTIVKPKAGLTPELFSRSVLEAALAGAGFTKADENCHLTRGELAAFVQRTVRDLERESFDLSPAPPRGSAAGDGSPAKRRFLFAPHITADPGEVGEMARVAVEAGANALMFSPYYSGGFKIMAQIAAAYDVPVYAHTAGMNLFTGSWSWGFDPAVMYLLAASFGAAFMQLPCVDGYLKPEDAEKPRILERLSRDGLAGEEGMTLVVAGGLGAGNIGLNMQRLGSQGRMFLAGTSVYGHPDGPFAGVQAIIQAVQAFRERGIVDPAELLEYGSSLGKRGAALVGALKEDNAHG